jgi:hypothetical protein
VCRGPRRWDSASQVEQSYVLRVGLEVVR